MQINLQNVGIVKDSTITIDGLSVITGKNNSGKTTVGKTLYSILDAVSNLQQKANNDKFFYIQRQIEKVESTLEVFRYLRVLIFDDKPDIFADYPALNKLINRGYINELSQNDIEQFAQMLVEELMHFDVSLFDKIDELNNYQKILRTRIKDKESASLASMFKNQREQALDILKKLFNDIKKDPELIAYARESINQTLRGNSKTLNA